MRPTSSPAGRPATTASSPLASTVATRSCAAYATRTSTMAGFLEAGDATLGVEVVPLIFTQTGPIGTITKDAFDRIVGEMLRAAGEQRAVGRRAAGASTARRSRRSTPTCDGEVARAGARDWSGRRADRHGDRHARQRQPGDDRPGRRRPSSYRTNPHLDPRAARRRVRRASSSGRCAARSARSRRSRCRRWSINIVKQYTGEEPMRGAGPRRRGRARPPGMLSASVAEGYPYADVAEMGMAFLAVHDGDPAAAREAARWLAAAPGSGAMSSSATIPVAGGGAPLRRRRPRRTDRADGRRRQHRRRQRRPTRPCCWRSPSGSACAATFRRSTTRRPWRRASRPASAREVTLAVGGEDRRRCTAGRST